MSQNKIIILTALLSVVSTFAITYSLMGTPKVKTIRNKEEISRLKDSIVKLEDKLHSYGELLKLTNLYLTDEEVISNDIFKGIENTPDSLMIETVDNINLHKKNLAEIKKSANKYRVVVDTVVKVEQDENSEIELKKVKTELAVTKSKVKKLENEDRMLELVSSKGKKFQYTGKTFNGKANGYGVGVFETGSVYKGQWKDNYRHGKGNFTWSDKEFYEGEFVKGKRHGYGEYHWSNGDIYKGYWKEDMRHGEGKLYKKNGKIKQEGTWENDNFAG